MWSTVKALTFNIGAALAPIVTRLADRMAPGGLMVPGLGEVVDWQHPNMDRVRFDNSLAYMRRTH